jgi:hypothetical protein
MAADPRPPASSLNSSLKFVCLDRLAMEEKYRAPGAFVFDFGMYATYTAHQGVLGKEEVVKVASAFLIHNICVYDREALTVYVQKEVPFAFKAPTFPIIDEEKNK